MISSIRYPACRSEIASAFVRFPVPTIAMLGFALMPGSIAEAIGTDLGSEVQGQVPLLLYSVDMPQSTSSHKKSTRSKTPHGKKARLISSRTVYRGPVFWITTDHVQEPGGIKVRRDLIHHSGSVVVLAVDDSGEIPHVLLERQYRHAAGDYMWELPAGRIDPGEQPLHAAKRELIEETGYRATNWRRILKFYASPGFVAETMSVFLATGLREGEAHPEADEIIYKRLVPLPTAVQMVIRGTIRDAKTISSVLWLDHTLRTSAKRQFGRNGRRKG
jgi:ADP-ribose diphosphatase